MKKLIPVLDKDNNVIRYRVRTYFPNESKTNQGKKNKVSINTIMARYHKAMSVASDPRDGLYGDFSDKASYHEALSRIRDAQNDFDQLSASLRKRFDNNPANLIDFLSDEKNREEAMDLGLISRPEIVKPIQVLVTNHEEASEANTELV